MFCPNCGNQMNDGAVFCTNCGFKNGSANNVKKSGKGFKVLILLPVVVIIAVVFIAYTVIANRHCNYDGCELKVYKAGYCQKHYAAMNAKSNVEDVISGNKSIGEAANDFYDKSLTKDQKKEIESGLNDLKDAIGGFFK